VRAAQVALMVISIQIGIGIITVTGLFGNFYYESEITGIDIGNSSSYSSDVEQAQTSVNIMNVITNALTWGWIKEYVLPWYNTNSSFKSFIDYIIMFLNSVSAILIGIAVLEFVRNRVDVLGG